MTVPADVSAMETWKVERATRLRKASADALGYGVTSRRGRHRPCNRRKRSAPIKSTLRLSADCADFRNPNCSEQICVNRDEGNPRTNKPGGSNVVRDLSTQLSVNRLE